MIPALAAVLALLFPAAVRAQDAALDAALRAEIARSTAALSQDDNPPPYFVGLRVSDEESRSVRCHMGSPVARSTIRLRKLTPDVRVGGYELDNHPLGPAGGAEPDDLPYGDDVFAIRHALWLALDASYKSGVAGYLRKQALRVRRGKADYETDDLSREPARVYAGAPVPEPWGAPGWMEETCLSLSALARGRPGTLWSEVDLRAALGRERLITSEGTDVSVPESAAILSFRAQDITSDGMHVTAARSFMALGKAGLPAPDRLKAQFLGMLADLDKLKVAESTTPLTAPALVDPTVAAAMIEAMAARLSGEEQRNPSGAQTFRGKIGQPVMPPFLTLTDEPALKELRGAELMGNYDVDDEGVPAQKAVLVERGALKGFLLSRYPTVDFPRSNGHGRAAPGFAPMGRPSNLVLTASEAKSERELLDGLRSECRRQKKPYGLWIRRARGWSQQGGTGRQQAFRLTPTLVYLVEAASGKMRLVRDLDMVGTPIDLVGKILAAGKDDEVTSSFMDQESGRIPVSTSAPSLLLAEVELQRADTKPQKAPVLPAPRP